MGFIFFSFKKTTYLTLLILLLFALSLLGFVYPTLNYIVFWAILILTLILTFKRLEYGVFILIMELFIGAKGYLFSFPIADYVVSLRLALFLIIILRYAFLVFKERKITFFDTKLWPSFFIFLIFIIIGLVNGLINNEAKIVFYDINAYFYFALIFPIFHVLFKKSNIKEIIKLLSVAAISLSILTMAILVDFSVFHYSPELIEATRVEAKQLEALDDLSSLPENARLGQTTDIAKEKLRLNREHLIGEKPLIYRWLKDGGLAEVTYIKGRFFRIFMISQFYVIVFLIILLTYLLHYKFASVKKKLVPILLMLIFFLVTIISFSRSFWLGFFIAFFFIFVGLPKKKILLTILTVLVLFSLLAGILYIATPEIFELFKERFLSLLEPSSELAATDRMNLITPILEKIKDSPALGSGFGTLVTYKTLIPGTELVEYVKVYLYEWGYLDIAVKLGIFGILSYLYFTLNIIKEGIRNIKIFSGDEKILLRGLLISLVFLLAVHITTPYLNHPLGIGLIMLNAAIFFKFTYLNLHGVSKDIN